MKRIGVIVPLLLIVGAALSLVLSAGANPTVTVDAIFDTADGMVPGQNVDVAGSKVGTVAAITLLHPRGGGYRALMELTIPRRFMPFRANASCRILPAGIISENYVDCNPGTSATALRRGPSGRPTIGLDHTSAPLSLQAVLDTFAAPAPERLTILIDELGIATAGRGEDMNAIIRRANPTLTQTSRVLAIVNRQRQELANAVTQTNQVLAALAARSADVRAFVDRAASVLDTTAAHRSSLEQSIRRLPTTLAAADGALAPIKQATIEGIPLLTDLRESAPGLTALNATLPAFTIPGRSALRAVGAAARSGLQALNPLAPVASHLSTLASVATPVTDLLDRLLVSIRDKGGIEGLLAFVYGITITWSSYDTVSHFALALPQVYATCVLENLTPYTKDSPGCSHAYTEPDYGQIPASNIPSSAAGVPNSSPDELLSFLRYMLK